MSDPTENSSSTTFHLYRKRTKKGKKERIASGRSNHALKAEKFGKELKDMPQTTFRVWYAMRNFECPMNYVNVRFRELAEFMDVSVGAVQDAMRYMEEHDLIVRVSEPGEKASWMINPELQWNWNRHLQPSGLAAYWKAKMEIKKNRNKKEKEMKDKNCDTIPHEQSNETGASSCESRLKAA